MSTILRISALALLAGATTGLGGCGTSEARNETVARETAALPVTAAAARRADVAATLEVTGHLEAEFDARITARVNGVIRDIRVEEGAAVEEGEILATVNAEQQAVELRQARAELAGLEQQHRRQKALLPEGLASAEAVERLGHEVRSLRAEVELAELALEHARIRAPFDGVVAQRLVTRGQHVEVDEPVFRVVDPHALVARVHIPEARAGSVRPGQSVAIRLDALPSRDFEGTVERTSPVIDREKGTVAATIAVNDADRLAPGMFGRFRIVKDVHASVVTVPRAAVIREDGNRFVYRIENERAVRTPVGTGYEDGGLIEITRGLEAGDRVITEGFAMLRDGTRVAAIETDQSLAGL